MKIKVNGSEYLVEYDFNSLCDTSVLEDVEKISDILSKGDSKISSIKDVFATTRSLLRAGLEAKNPVESDNEAGLLIQVWTKETGKTIFDLFGELSDELEKNDFLSVKEEETKKVIPLDHQKKQK